MEQRGGRERIPIKETIMNLLNLGWFSGLWPLFFVGVIIAVAFFLSGGTVPTV